MKSVCECCGLELNYDIDSRGRKLKNVVVVAVSSGASFLIATAVQRAMLNGDAEMLSPADCRKCSEKCGARIAIEKLKEQKMTS